MKIRPLRRLKRYVFLVCVVQLASITLKADDCEFKPKYCVQMSEVARELQPVRDRLRDLRIQLAEIETMRRPASVKNKKTWKEQVATAKRSVEKTTLEVERLVKSMSMKELTDAEHDTRLKTLKLAQEEIGEAVVELQKVSPTTYSKN